MKNDNRKDKKIKKRKDKKNLFSNCYSNFKLIEIKKYNINS